MNTEAKWLDVDYYIIQHKDGDPQEYVPRSPLLPFSLGTDGSLGRN